MTWLDDLTLSTVIVTTTDDGPSLRGLKRAVYDDGILLSQAAVLEADALVTLEGDVFVPREKVQLVQILLRWRVTTLQTADGRLLRSSASRRPPGSPVALARVVPPMWSEWRNRDTQPVLRSYEAIYRSQPILAGAVDKIARRAATLPFAPYRQLANGSRTASS
jgi:hypothetical protein